jgi:hypothetical protein
MLVINLKKRLYIGTCKNDLDYHDILIISAAPIGQEELHPLYLTEESLKI